MITEIVYRGTVEVRAQRRPVAGGRLDFVPRCQVEAVGVVKSSVNILAAQIEDLRTGTKTVGAKVCGKESVFHLGPADLGEFVNGLAEVMRGLMLVLLDATPTGLTEALREAIVSAAPRFAKGDVLRMLALLG